MDPAIIGALIAGGMGLVGAIGAALLSKRGPNQETPHPNVPPTPPERPDSKGVRGGITTQTLDGDELITSAQRMKSAGRKRSTSRTLKTLRMTEVEQLDDPDSGTAWTPQATIQKLMSYDVQYFDGISQEHEGSLELWIKKWTDHPDTGRVLFVRTSSSGTSKQGWRPIGYWSFTSLSQDAFDLVKAGVFCDGWLSGLGIPERYVSKDIRMVPSDFAGVYNMYFISVCLDRRHIGSKAFTALFDSFFDAVAEFAKHGIFFNEIATHAYTPRGQYWCEQLHLPRLIEYASGKGSIHYLRVPPWPSHSLINRHPELLELYQGKLGEPDAAPNGGPTTPSDKSGVSLGPLSVS